jgi:Secretion system C-terminal sorting domain
MRFLLILVLCLPGCLSLAQTPVINRSDCFGIGDSVYVYHKSDTTLLSFSSGASGTNALWDFSAMDFNHQWVSVDTLFYIDPAGTPFYPVTLSADYSQSNLCVNRKKVNFDPSNDLYTYYYADQDSFSFIGQWANNSGWEQWEDHCTDFLKELVFPFSYNDSFSDHFERFFVDYSGSDEHYITGSVNVNADAYGTMITPEGETVNNVLRLHSFIATRDSNHIFGITNYLEEYYHWYSSERKGIILSMRINSANQQIEWVDYYRQVNFNTSVNSLTVNNSLLMFPNPSDGLFTVTLKNKITNGKLEIFDCVGKSVFEKSQPDEQMIFNFKTFEKGIYLLRWSWGSESVTSRIVIF